MRIALLHYTCPPVPGGVERIIAEHAALFAAHGHDVTLLCGEGSLPAGEDGSRLRVQIVPALREKDRGAASSPDWEERIDLLQRELEPLLAGNDLVFLHNVLTMPFQPALTAALWSIASRSPASSLKRPRFIAWIHDLAAANRDYALPDAPEIPWSLFRRAHPAIEYVSISESRRAQFCQLTGLAPERCRVIPNGVDPLERLPLTPAVRRVAQQRAVLDFDVVLLHPARLLRRKNLEWSLRLVAALRELLDQPPRRDAGDHSAHGVLLLLTAALDPHQESSAAYRRELHALCTEHDLDRHVLWIPAELHSSAPSGPSESDGLSPADVDSLYLLADALLFPSHHEGFGLPILEAALHRIPIFCSDTEPLRSLLPRCTSPLASAPPSGTNPGSPDSAPPGVVTTFRPEAAIPAVAAEILRQIRSSAAIQARKTVIRQYGWPAIYRNYLAPLLAESASFASASRAPLTSV